MIARSAPDVGRLASPDRALAAAPRVPAGVSTRLSRLAPFLGIGAGFGTASVVSLLAGIVRQRLFAMFLGPAGLGFVASAARLQELLVTACQMGIAPGVIRQVAQARSRNERAPALTVVRSAAVMTLAVSALAVLLVVLFRRALADRVFGSPEHGWAAAWVVASIPPLVVSAICLAVLNGLEDYRSLVLHNVAVVVAGVAVVAGLVPVLGLRGAVWSIPAGGLVAAGLGLFLARRAFRRHLATGVAGAAPEGGGVLDLLWLGGVTYVDTLLASAVAVGVSVIFLERRTLEELGYYQAAQGASRLYMAVLTTSVFSYLMPRLSRLTPLEAVREQNDTLRTLLFMVVPLAGGVILLRHEVVRALFGSAFRPVEPLLPVIGVGDVLYGVVWVVGASFIPMNRLRSYAVSSVFSQLAAALLLWLLIPRWGAPGAALAYTAARAASLAAVLALQWREVRFRIDPSGWLMLASGLALLLGLGRVPASARLPQLVGLLALMAWLAAFRSASLQPGGGLPRSSSAA
jgi:O-antigen/teichoic acid export membrane protein